MATTNPVMQVLVTSGNQTVLGAGNTPANLGIGQLGVFKVHDNISVDATSDVNEFQNVYLAVGTDKTGSGTLEDINKSAGQMIQVRNVKALTVKPYTSKLPKVIKLTGFSAKCETEYAIKIEFRNQQIYGLYGYNQFTKVFTYKTSCCTQEDCVSCPQGDANELAIGLVNEVNKDTDKLVLAELIDPTNNAVVTNTATWIAANPTLTLGIKFTSIPEAINNFMGINIKYFNPRGTDMIISLPTGFSCNGTITTLQNLRYEEGLGYDIQQLEYVAGGFNGKPGPYRVSITTNMPRTGIEYFANRTTQYTQFTLTYDMFSVGGWQEYLNNLETVVAIPCADEATIENFAEILDKMFTGRFGTILDDVQNWDGCPGSITTSSLNKDTDGIEVVS